MNSEIKKLNVSPGTELHALNSFRTDALSNLLNDLVLNEEYGFDDNDGKDVCKQVRVALGKIVNEFSSLPDGGFLRKVIWKDIQRFEDKYIAWNSIYGNDTHAITSRQKALKALRDRRNKIATRIRKNMHRLQSELDFALIDAFYKALQDLVKSLPDVFVNLNKAVSHYYLKNSSSDA